MRLSNIFFYFPIFVLFSQLMICDYCRASGPGTSSADFLKIPVGARETALGGTFSAVSDNSNAVYYNPAGLGLIKSPEVSFTYNKYVEGISQQWLSFVYPYEFGTLGLGFNYLAVSPFDSYDNNNNRTGSVSAADMAVFFSYGRTVYFGHKLIRSLSFGASVKHISQRLDDKNGYGGAFDIGLLALSGIENLKLSFGVDNVVSNEIQFIDEKAELPATYKTGIAYKLASPNSPVEVLISAQENFPEDGNGYISAGMENIFYGAVALRIGYRSFGNISNPVSFGLGLDLDGDAGGNIRLDYSFGASDYFGNIQKLTVSFKLGKSSKYLLKGEMAAKEGMRKDVIVVSTESAISKAAENVVLTRNPLADYYSNILSSGDLPRILKVISELGKNKSVYSIKLLLELADNENPRISASAARVLKGFKDPDIILKMLNIKNEDARASAIACLKGYKGARILKALEVTLHDKSPKIREKAAEAFGDYGEKIAINFLVYALKNERDENVMTAIIKALRVLSETVKDE